MKKPLKKRFFRLRPLNVFVTFGLGAILLIILTSFIIAFTGLREYIPDMQIWKRRDAFSTWFRRQILWKHNWLRGMNTLKISEKSSTEHLQNKNPDLKSGAPVSAYDTIHKLHKSVEDLLLRQEIESQDQFSLAVNDNSSLSNSISSFYFSSAQGYFTNRFDPITKHFGIDIVSMQMNRSKQHWWYGSTGKLYIWNRMGDRDTA